MTHELSRYGDLTCRGSPHLLSQAGHIERSEYPQCLNAAQFMTEMSPQQWLCCHGRWEPASSNVERKSLLLTLARKEEGRQISSARRMNYSPFNSRKGE